MVTKWDAIESRLHEETALRYPDNKMRKILEATLNGLLGDLEKDTMDLFYESFLITATGKYLDLRGEEFGIKRESNENDESYRKRIFNLLASKLSVSFVKKQGIDLYSVDDLNNNIRPVMTSHNPYLSNLYAGFPNNSYSRNFLLGDMIYEYVIKYYIKGWD